MGRRSDHSRDELRALIIDAGQKHLAEVGYARFSARRVARLIGYSVGTLYNVFDDHDQLILAINARTLDQWAAFLRERLEEAGDDRIAALVEGYFDFARQHTNLWMAIYDHRLPPGIASPAWSRASRMALTEIIYREVAARFPHAGPAKVAALARSLIATVHGHCAFALNGVFDLLEENHPTEAALARVREALAAAGKSR